MKQKIPVLCYHDIVDSKKMETLTANEKRFIIDKNIFEKEMKLLKIFRYKTITLEEFYQWKKGKIKLPYKSILITFDDGYKNVYSYALPILKKYNLNACIFTIGKKIESNQKNYISKEIIDICHKEYPNIEFACHSYNLHVRGSVEMKNVSELEEDLEKYVDVMNPTEYFAYPYGHYTDNIIEALKNKKYKLAFAFGDPKKARKDSNDYLIPRIDASYNQNIWKFILKVIIPFIY